MKIGLDIRMIDFSGIGTTVRGLLDNLSDPQLKSMHLFSNSSNLNGFKCETTSVSYPVYSFCQHWSYAQVINKSPIDLFHMPHFDVPFFIKKPFVATVHDLIHILFPQYSTKPFSNFYASVVLKNVCRNATRIICVSQNTKKDLMKFSKAVEGKIDVIYPGVSKGFYPENKIEIKKVLNAHQLTEGYILYVGNLRGSKNTEGLIQAYLKLKAVRPNSPPLVLGGKNFLKKYQNGFPDGVRYIGLVDSKELRALYSGASLFVFPSFYEGFGLPPLEAMACGTPVISSDRASLPEVGGDAPLFVNPDSPGNIMKAIQLVLDNADQSKKMRSLGLENAKRFSWEKFTQSTWDIYEDVVGRLTK